MSASRAYKITDAFVPVGAENIAALRADSKRALDIEVGDFIVARITSVADIDHGKIQITIEKFEVTRMSTTGFLERGVLRECVEEIARKGTGWNQSRAKKAIATVERLCR